MTSEEDHRSKLNIIIGRIRTVIIHHSRLMFPISIIVATLLCFFVSNNSHLFTSSSSSSSISYVSKRYGLGAGDSTGELKSALRRKGDGRAAVAIIRVIGGNGTEQKQENAQYLVQMKSHDYPIEAFRGAVSLLGGNANTQDKTPLDTLKRELNEELHFPNWVDVINSTKVVDHSNLQSSDKPFYDPVESDPPMPGTIRYLGATMHFQSSELIQKSNPYAFVCGLYEITLTTDQLPPSVINPRGANIQEGRIVLLTEDQLILHSKFAWGYEYTIEKYFGKGVAHKQVGAAVSVVDEKTWNNLMWTPLK